MSRYPRRGRGAAYDPPNSFERLALILDEEEEHARSQTGRPTEFFVDSSRSIIVRNDSPDVGFSASINPYRGCEHGCIYCYARPGHEFLGLSGGLDFESKIFVKQSAPELLAKALSKKSWTPQVLALSGVTDPYQPIERRLQLTRRCLETLLAFRNPVAIVTKNHLITRDIDILSELARMNLVHVMISITSLKDELIHRMEPRTSRPARRLRAIEKLVDAGVPVGVLVAPVIPGLTDEEMPAILAAAGNAGATSAGYIMLRLPGVVEELFLAWIHDHFPERAKRIENRIRSTRGGRLSDSRFGHRMRGTGETASIIEAMYRQTVRRLGMDRTTTLDTSRFVRGVNGQASLF